MNKKIKFQKESEACARVNWFLQQWHCDTWAQSRLVSIVT